MLSWEEGCYMPKKYVLMPKLAISVLASNTLGRGMWGGGGGENLSSPLI